MVNCGNYADVKASGWSTFAGGLVGFISEDDSVILQCFNVGNVVAYETDSSSRDVYGRQYAGGITANGGFINQCYNTGSVTATGKDYLKAGGITVCTFDKVSNCYNTGAVSASTNATESEVAGIIVDCPTAVEYCYNTGDLTGTKMAGIVVNLYDGTTNYDTERHALNCYYLNTASVGVYQVVDSCTNEVYSKTESAMKQQSTFVDFDFDGIWTILDGYPELINIP